ncbi:hypothetical protein RUM43_003781 [Polyplax serrata]|uniref:Uncharacterized protein n=1 Tax=Polyplax serrata TaxID=468196 RepID=A0AAN8S3D4_POLSC
MAKAKREDKILVRNSMVSVPSNVLEKESRKPRRVHFTAGAELSSPECDDAITMRNPEFRTVLKLAHEVNEIRSATCSIHPISEKLKYTNLDYLPKEKVFQNLIDLDLTDRQPAKSMKTQSSRNIFKKDQEPNYQNLLNYNLEPVYFFSSSIRVTAERPKPGFEGYSVYDTLQISVRECII